MDKKELFVLPIKGKPVKIVSGGSLKCPLIYKLTNGEIHSLCEYSKWKNGKELISLECTCKNKTIDNCLYKKYFKP